MNKTIQTLVLLLLSCAVHAGCREANPLKPEDKKVVDDAVPTPDQARLALIRLIENGFDGARLGGDGAKIEKFLRSEKQLKSLQEDNITTEGDYTYIGGWVCKLKEKTCTTGVSWGPPCAYDVKGRFEKNGDNSWKVVIAGIAHLNLGHK